MTAGCVWLASKCASATARVLTTQSPARSSPPAGTRDFFPEDMRLRNWLFGEFAAVSQLFGFEQFDVPVLESEELFVRKVTELLPSSQERQCCQSC